MFRIITGMLIVLLVPLGIYTKFYHGPFYFWVNNSLGGIFYVLFFSLCLAFVVPRLNPLKNAAYIFVGTSGVELLQLWHPPFLKMLRSHFLGRTLLGTTFVPQDFLCYLAGGFSAYFLLRWLQYFGVSHSIRK